MHIYRHILLFTTYYLSGYFIPIALSARPTLVDGDLGNLTVAEGKDASFSCSVKHLGGHKVAWIKADQSNAILAIHDHVITNKDKISVTRNDKSTWTLKIKQVTKSDAGSYMCQINSKPMVYRKGALTVTVPPTILDSLSTKSVSVLEGQHAELVCKAEGYPEPEINWYREGSNKFVLNGKRRSGSHLRLSNVTRYDMGVYMCIAKNGVAPAKSKAISVSVNFKPDIKVTNDVLGAPIGTLVTLECVVEAFPQAIVFWSMENGDMIVGTDHFSVRERKSNNFRLKSKLVIRNLKKEHYQTYTCMAKNTIGISNSSVDLYEIKKSTDAYYLKTSTYKLTTVTQDNANFPSKVEINYKEINGDFDTRNRRKKPKNQPPKLSIPFFDQDLGAADTGVNSRMQGFYFLFIIEVLIILLS